MEKSSSNDIVDGIGDSPNDNLSTKDSLDVLDDLIGSPLTPTANVSFSTPHEPTRRRSLIECFDTLLTISDADEADCYDSDGNEPPCVVDNEFVHFEGSIDDISGGENPSIPSSSKFVFLSNEQIDALKVDELKQELLKRSLSKSGLKAELRERLKQAMVDEIPVADVEKTSPGPEGFDQGCKWRILEPSTVAIKPQCKDPTLLNPSSEKYANGTGGCRKLKDIPVSPRF